MESESILKNRRWTILSYILLFGAATVMLYHAPLISDDFEFADYRYAKLSQVLPYVLYYGNGRLLGNVGAVWLINYPLICAIIKSAVICGVVWALPKAAGIQHKPEYSVIAALLLLLMNPDIFAQVFTWTSGFMNYVPPVLTMLLCLIIVRTSTSVTVGRFLALGLVGFAGQLFVEHATVIHIMMAVLLLALYLAEKDPVRSRYAMCWLVAALAGALLMFAIPKVFYLEENRVAGYRVFHLTDVIRYAAKSVVLMLHTLSGAPVLFILLSVFAVPLRKVAGKRFSWRCFWYWIYPIVSCVFQMINSESGVLKVLRYLLLYGGMFLYAAMLLLDIWRYADQSARREMLTLTGLAVVSLLPFLVISPFGERCVFLCYCLLCMLMLRGLQYLREKNGFVLPQGAVKMCSAAIMVVLLLLCGEFFHIKGYDVQRDDYIREQIAEGEEEITIFDIPSRYAFTTYLPEMYYYNETRRDTSFAIIGYDEWVELVDKK